MEPLYLYNSIPWFGNHTGYEQLVRWARENGDAPVQALIPSQTIFRRAAGKLYSIVRGWPARNTYDAAAELLLDWARWREQADVFHILYLGDHLHYLDRWRHVPRRIIGTIHQPPSQWGLKERTALSRLSSAIVLYRRDLSFFEDLVGEGRVQFIPHGADTEFFVPDREKVQPRRLLFVGHHLRNMEMLRRVVGRLDRQHSHLRFDLLLPKRFRTHDALQQLPDEADIHWHQRLSDEELRTLYQSSYLLLLPMNDSGANTAVVEALSCGLPIVTCDVGGIRDYGGGNLFPLVENNDDEAMIGLVEQYLDDPEWREEVAGACRTFAEEKLAWPGIARRHVEAYRNLTQP